MLVLEWPSDGGEIETSLPNLNWQKSMESTGNRDPKVAGNFEASWNLILADREIPAAFLSSTMLGPGYGKLRLQKRY